MTTRAGWAAGFLALLQGAHSQSKWPWYQLCVNDASPNGDKSGPAISRANFTWCMTAISGGHGIEATAAGIEI